MTTSTTQIDGMEKELLEYYHKNEDRFKKYSNDIDLLKAKLFEGMINDGCFPKRQPKVKRDLTTEYECTQWLSRAAGEQLTFKDFRKMFKSRLKKCELWSEEFYDVCKGIIGDRQNFLDCRKCYEEKKAVLYKNNRQFSPVFIANKEIGNTILHREPINIDDNIISKSYCKDFLPKNYTTESNIEDDFYWFATILVWVTISYVLAPLLGAIFLYLIVLLEFALTIITVPIGAILGTSDFDLVPLHEYVTDNKLTFWIWLNCLTSAPMLLYTVYDLIKNTMDYININGLHKYKTKTK